jgi:hypothetical protein
MILIPPSGDTMAIAAAASRRLDSPDRARISADLAARMPLAAGLVPNGAF